MCVKGKTQTVMLIQVKYASTLERLSKNVWQYYAITGCETTSFSYRIGKINPYKEGLRKLSCLCFVECLRENKPLSE